MISQPRDSITVITAVRNGAPQLEATIESVLEHGRGADYLIVDGGSTDGTLEIIRRYEKRLTGWISEPDRGVYDAMNKGWAMASPESRILFLGAGDRLLSLPGEPSGESMEDSVFYGNVLVENDQLFRAHSGFRLKLYNALHHQALLVPKRLHPAPPFDLTFPHYADFDFNQRLQTSGTVFRFLPGFKAYAAPGGLTGELRLEELLSIINRNYGPVWAGLSRLGFVASRRLPLLRKLRPIG